MPIAQSYGPGTPKRKPAGGPSEADVFASKFSAILSGPQIKIFQYGIVPEVSRGLPIVKDVVDFLKWARDPIAELKKELEIDDRANVFSPRAGEYYVAKLATHTLALGGKTIQVVSNLNKIGRGELPDTALVRSAMAYESALLGEGYRKNPAKFLVGKTWDFLVKGNFLDNLIYDKQYIFHMAETKDGMRYARWRNNSLVEQLNARTAKYGQALEGPELKFGASSFATRLSEKGKMVKLRNGDEVFQELGRVKFLKGLKVAWQVLGPTAAVAVVFPPAWPAMLGWQLVNINWKEIKKRQPMVQVSENQLEIWKKQRGYVDATRPFTTPDGSRVVRDSKGVLQAVGETPRHKFLDTMSDFGSLRGWYDTFVTGKSLKSRGWGRAEISFPSGMSLTTFQKEWSKIILYDPKIGTGNLSNHLFSQIPGGLGMRHVGFNLLNNSYIYEQKIIAPFGLIVKGVNLGGKEITVRLFKDAAGNWKHASEIFISAAKSGVAAQIMRAAYYVQQATIKIVAPIALAVVVPNPVTAAYALFSASNGIRQLTAPFRSIAWRGVVDGDTTKWIARFGRSAAGRVFVRMVDNGNSFTRKLMRSLYSFFHPLDREVGWLRGLVMWRNRMWNHSQKDLDALKNSRFGQAAGGLLKSLDKLLSRIPVLGFVYNLVKRAISAAIAALKKTPIVGVFVRAFGFVVGLAKWANSPIEAIRDFFKDLAKRGVRRVIKGLFKKYLAKPLIQLLQKWAAKMGTDSFAGRLLNYFANGLKDFIKPDTSKLVQLRSWLSKVVNFLKDIPQKLERFIRALVQFVKTTIRFIRTSIQVVKTALQIIKSAATIFANPVTWIVLLIVVIIALIILIAIMMWFVLSLLFGRFSTAPVSGTLMVEKRVVTTQTRYNAGDEIKYSIRFKTLKSGLQDTVRIEDYFLVRGSDPATGTTKEYFDPASIDCGTEARPEYHIGGPEGEWYRAQAVTTDPITNVGTWYEVTCSVRVAAGYTGGELVNHAIVTGVLSLTPLITDSASQYLYLNSSRPEGWPVDHGCFTQGPNGVFSHQGQQAVDIGNNNSLGFNINGQPVRSTFGGVVQRICVEGDYSASAKPGVCGGQEAGSYFGTFFGTYVLVKDSTTGAVALYAHLLDPTAGLSVGQTVNRGDVIGYVDNTGNSTAPHLHFAFTRAGGLTMGPPNVPYYVPACSGTAPDSSCADAFTSLGESSRVCF